ncbi:ABC transporter substrate-binding protein [Terrarubrum flagellatum]|uniref:ABC transporter substrate-binding protein n=1 Tax=Terrirubrum flagellatum TaxID=2895980 RepID=UPI003145297B
MTFRSGPSRRAAAFGGAIALASIAAPAFAQDKVTFGTNWVAQAEHGGYYQAVADGTYKKYGLDVTIVPGGPSANNRMLMTLGKLDFYMGGMLQAFNAVDQNIPTVTIAAIFQKDPQVLLAHPDQGLKSFADLKNLPSIYVAKEGLASYYQWMKAAYGFKDEQVKPYTFNPQPFLADKKSAMQGYLSSEPYLIEKTAGFKPQVFLLADAGYDPYSTTIETTLAVLKDKPDVAKRFVEATIIGWNNYLYGDNKAANALIKKDNPEMSDDKIEYAIVKMKELGIVDSGDTIKLGIGAMTDERVKEYYEKMVKAGVLKAGLDWKKTFDARFVNKGLGVDLRKN